MTDAPRLSPDSAVARQASAGGRRRPAARLRPPREYLEEFPLDSLRMVGTINMNNAMYGLISTTDGAVHRVRIGEYLGQNHGRITAISETRIDLTEIIPDGTGGWTERRAGVALSE
jgi:type IV pilus assembly protein PilP